MELLYVGLLTVVVICVLRVVQRFQHRTQRLSAAQELPRLVAMAGRPGRRLVVQSVPEASVPYIVLDLGGFRLQVARRGWVDRAGSRVTELMAILPGADPEYPRLYFHTVGWDEEDNPEGPLVPPGLRLVETRDPWLRQRAAELWAEEKSLPLLASSEFLGGLREVDEMFGRPGVRVVVAGGAVRVCKRCLLRDDAALEPLVLAAIRVVDATRYVLEGPFALPVSSEGVELLPSDDEVPGEVICAVCGVAVGTEGICCPSCGVPQHPDCWDYFGSCATYACPGRLAPRPRGQGGTRWRNL